MLHRVASRRAARANADLGEDGAEVGVNRTGAEAEPIGDLSVGQPGCDQLQNVHLAGRQLIRKRLARDSRTRTHNALCYTVLSITVTDEETPARLTLRRGR